MRESPVEVAVGAAVLAVAVGFLAYVLNVTDQSAGGAEMALSASFRSIEGISLGTPVRMAGVPLGSVSDIALNPETYRVDTVLTVTSSIPVPDDSTAIVASEGLLGGNFIEIVPGGSLTYFADGAEIVDTQGSVSLLNLLVTAVGGGTDGSTAP
jgi:phospholipid/cholesterol/gamma-HCH transport system substrate-binding protein